MALVHQQLLDAEIGTERKDAPNRVALVYPSPYRAAMSSLGYQAIYGVLNDQKDTVADRAMLPDEPQGLLTTLERNVPVGNYPLIAFSVAYPGSGGAIYVAVPEPAASSLLALGVAGLAYLRRRKHP